MAFEILLKAATRELEETEAEWKLRLRQLNRDIQATKLELRRTQLYALGIVSGITSMLSVLVGFLPQPLQIVGSAIVNLVQTTVSTLVALAAAYTAGGPWFWVQAIMTGIAIGFAAVGLVTAVMGQQQLETDVERFGRGVHDVLRGLDNLRYNLGV